jgi:hypothetical protein
VSIGLLPECDHSKRFAYELVHGSSEAIHGSSAQPMSDNGVYFAFEGHIAYEMQVC